VWEQEGILEDVSDAAVTSRYVDAGIAVFEDAIVQAHTSVVGRE